MGKLGGVDGGRGTRENGEYNIFLATMLRICIRGEGMVTD